MDYDSPDRPKFQSEDNLEHLIERYPYLVEAWLEEYNPSTKVAKILREKGYNV